MFDDSILRALKAFEKGVILVLTALMALAIVYSTVELGVALAKSLFTPPLFTKSGGLLDIFGLFLLVLLGVELLETLKAYLREDVVHVEVVMIVALIAIARKVIILDLKALDGFTLIGLAALLVALAFCYQLIRTTHGGPPERSR